MRSIAPALVLLALLIGCESVDTMTEGFKHSQEVAGDLEGAVGSKPFVGFNWANGALVNVSVTFEGIPAGRSAEQIAQLSRDAIAARFKQKPRQIVIGFTIPGS